MEAHQVVGAVLRQGNQVLLCHRSPERSWFPDRWDLPGGHVRPGEEPEAALRRELAEELGVERIGLDGPPVLHQVDTDHGFDLTVWVTTSWRGTVANRQPAEHDALGWFGREQFGELRFADPSYMTLLEGLLAP
jgi:8-oxo-dGTP diphosphatase